MQNVEKSADEEVNTEFRDAPTTEHLPPALRYKDQTPLKPADKKRAFSTLSSLTDEDDVIMQRMERVIESCINKIIPTIVSTIETTLHESLKKLVNESIDAAKDEIRGELRSEMSFQERSCELKTLSETELLECYNRRDNVRIIGVTENIRKDREGSTTYEVPEATMETVAKIANAIGAGVKTEDTSIAHRLPSKMQGPRPIIVRFCRRISETSLLRNKKKLAELENLKTVRIMEDLSGPRVKFLSIMKNDDRLENVRTREGAILYNMKGNRRNYRVTGIYEAAEMLGYHFNTLEQCFNIGNS